MRNTRKLRRSLARAARRRQLFHAARLARGDASFFANLHQIEAEVSAQLAREFPDFR